MHGRLAWTGHTPTQPQRECRSVSPASLGGGRYAARWRRWNASCYRRPRRQRAGSHARSCRPVTAPLSYRRQRAALVRPAATAITSTCHKLTVAGYWCLRGSRSQHSALGRPASCAGMRAGAPLPARRQLTIATQKPVITQSGEGEWGAGSLPLALGGIAPINRGAARDARTRRRRFGRRHATLATGSSAESA